MAEKYFSLHRGCSKGISFAQACCSGLAALIESCGVPQRVQTSLYPAIFNQSRQHLLPESACNLLEQERALNSKVTLAQTKQKNRQFYNFRLSAIFFERLRFENAPGGFSRNGAQGTLRDRSLCGAKTPGKRSKTYQSSGQLQHALSHGASVLGSLETSG